MRKIVTIVGARPQFIKAAVVSRAMRARNKDTENALLEIIVHTGQHYDSNMSEVFFREMDIPSPDYHLGICNATHGVMTGKMLGEIELVLMKERPDMVLVYGDTNSTLAGALAAVKMHVPVAHVEAGLRSFNMLMPEEINRILTDKISTLLFCPTETAMLNLTTEGIGISPRIKPIAPLALNVGDVMYDAVLHYRSIKQASLPILDLLNNIGGSFYLATVHRAENTDDANRLRNIIGALRDISKKTPVVFPLHPRTKKIAEGCGVSLRGITVIDPVGYFDMLTLLENSKAVFTDSGGLQKEAFFFGKHCITLRDETEWIELVEGGFNSLAGADRDRILNSERRLTEKSPDFSVKLYGEGDAGKRIVETLLEAEL